jgi:hypothetical protein
MSDVEGGILVVMIEEDRTGERIAIERYREMVRCFGDKDSTPRAARTHRCPDRRPANARETCRPESASRGRCNVAPTTLIS